MTRARILQEVRQIRVEELHERRQRRTLTMAEATERQGVTERTCRRWSNRYDAEGVEGLQDRRLGRPSVRAVSADEALRMLTCTALKTQYWLQIWSGREDLAFGPADSLSVARNTATFSF